MFMTVIATMMSVLGTTQTPQDLLWVAIVKVESGGNPKARNVKEDACGVAQIRPIMVRECNRIARVQCKRLHFTLADRWSPAKSRQMFDLYTAYWCKVRKVQTDEAKARLWNGGPTGHRKKATRAYWAKVKRALKKI